MKRIVVVGAGLGGLSTAIMLARAGHSVEIVEKNERIGGKLNVLRERGFTFDLGPSILTLPHMFRPLFEGNGKRLEDYVPCRRLDPQWRNFFEDGKIVDLFEDRAKMTADLDSVGASAREEFFRFLDYSKKQYDDTDRGYFEKGLDTFWQFVRHYGFKIGQLDFRRTMAGAIEEQIADPYLRDILEYFIKYVGSSAYDAPGFMNLMPNIQFEYGLWYVDGGLYGIAEGLAKRLEELNVRIRLNTEVKRITQEGSRVTGIEVAGGERLAADFVVSNMEVLPAYDKLLNVGAKFKRSLEKFEPACSGLVLHLGTKKVYPQLAHHNFFYSHNQKSHFHRVFREGRLPDDPTIYLVASSVTDSTQAPAGGMNLKILPHIPHLGTKVPYTREDCDRLKETVVDKLERMGLADLRANTVFEHFWTPFDIQEKYFSNQGSIYGVVSDRKKNFAFKAPKRSRKFRNLFFVGGSVNPGGGMPMVVLSGQKVAEMILREP